MHAVCSALHTTILLTAEADYLIAIRCGMPSATGSGVHRTASCVASHRKCIDCVLFNLKVKYIRKAMSEVIVYGIYIYAKNDVVMCLCARKFSSTFGLSLSLRRWLATTTRKWFCTQRHDCNSKLLTQYRMTADIVFYLRTHIRFTY